MNIIMIIVLSLSVVQLLMTFNSVLELEISFSLITNNSIGRRGGLVVSAHVSGSSGLGSSPACVVFLDKALYSLSDSLHPGV